jgi:hypothetical protein
MGLDLDVNSLMAPQVISVDKSFLAIGTHERLVIGLYKGISK